MKWYFLDSGEGTGEENMATDLALMEEARKGFVIVRLYGWNPPALSLGKFQKLEDVNVENVRKHGFDLVRRPSGGRAVLHFDEITYAIVLPESLTSKSIIRTYMEISQALVAGLNMLGLNAYMARGRSKERYTDFSACFATTSIHEVMIDGKKLVGSAQTRRNGVVLQHGSIPLRSHIDEYVGCFKLTEIQVETLKKRLIEKTTCVFDHACVELDEVKAALLMGFKKTFGVNFTPFDGVLNREKYMLEVKV